MHEGLFNLYIIFLSAAGLMLLLATAEKIIDLICYIIRRRKKHLAGPLTRTKCQDKYTTKSIPHERSKCNG